MSAWAWVALAGLCEIVWALALRASAGFTRPVPITITVVFGAASFVLLAKALQGLPMGTAYAVWTGIGAAGTAVLGIVLYAESASPARIVSLLLILAGIAGLKLFR
jgi:quaternary ammonium compound-resistance protein SugE